MLVWLSATVNVRCVILSKSFNLRAVHFLLIPSVRLFLLIEMPWELNYAFNDYPTFSDVLIF